MCAMLDLQQHNRVVWGCPYVRVMCAMLDLQQHNRVVWGCPYVRVMCAMLQHNYKLDNNCLILCFMKSLEVLPAANLLEIVRISHKLLPLCQHLLSSVGSCIDSCHIVRTFTYSNSRHNKLI